MNDDDHIRELKARLAPYRPTMTSTELMALMRDPSDRTIGVDPAGPDSDAAGRDLPEDTKESPD